MPSFQPPRLRNYRFFGVSYMANIVPRNATGHGRGGGQTRTIPVNYRQNRFGGVDIFGVKKRLLIVRLTALCSTRRGT